MYGSRELVMVWLCESKQARYFIYSTHENEYDAHFYNVS